MSEAPSMEELLRCEVAHLREENARQRTELLALRSLQSGVESNAHPASVRSMVPLSDTCEACPICRAALIQQTQGDDEAAHFLRVQVVELKHKLALTRSELRRRGVDPDIAYLPHDADKPADTTDKS